jgi:phosphate-selective porin
VCTHWRQAYNNATDGKTLSTNQVDIRQQPYSRLSTARRIQPANQPANQQVIIKLESLLR